VEEEGKREKREKKRREKGSSAHSVSYGVRCQVSGVS
jgi:hypothetical protein